MLVHLILDFRSPGLSPGQGQMCCVLLARHFTTHSVCLHPGVQMGTGRTVELISGVNRAMD